jgi:hypothetical protein
MLNQETAIDQLFHALAVPVRRSMMERLSLGPASVTELAKPLAISLPAVVQHLEVLETSGLVRSEKKGRLRNAALSPPGCCEPRIGSQSGDRTGSIASIGWRNISARKLNPTSGEKS